MTSSEVHIPVLKREALDALNIQRGGTYVDATLGRAGHAQSIAESIGDSGRLIAIDRDPRAIELGEQVFAQDSRVQILHGEFNQMKRLISDNTDIQFLDGVLMDLGVSSPQLDQAERGFSFMRDGAFRKS